MKTLLSVLLIAMALTAQAGGLSQLAAKVSRPLQKVVVVACATTCLLGFSPKAYGQSGNTTIPLLKEMSAGYGSGHEHLFFGGKLGIPGRVPGSNVLGSFSQSRGLGCD